MKHSTKQSYFNAEWNSNLNQFRTYKIIKGKSILGIRKKNEKIWELRDKDNKIIGWFGIKLKNKTP